MEKSFKDRFENMPESLKKRYESLPDDLKEKVKNATSLEELNEILGSSTIELTEQDLDAVSGGCSTEVYGDDREFDSYRMPAAYMTGEDLGF